MTTEVAKAEPVAEAVPEVRELTAEDILKAPDLAPEPLDVPEWGGRVYMRRLSAAQGMELGKNAKLDEAGSNIRVVAFGVCNKSGNPLFTVAQIEQLRDKNLKVLNTVSNKILILNGIMPDPAELQKVKDELKKV